MERTGGLEAVQTRHVDVHDHHVGAVDAGFEEVERGLSVVHLPDHLDAWIGVQEFHEQHPGHPRIVCHQHFDLVGMHILNSRVYASRRNVSNRSL